MAAERRIEKISILIKEELAQLIARDIEFPEGTFVTVTRVDVSPDVHYASVFISILGNSGPRALEILSKKVYTIQQLLNRKVRMRPVPRIRFEVDEAEKNRESVEKSIAELKRKGEL